MHLAPFKQGLCVHPSTVISQSVPAYPGGHEHV